MCGTGEKSCAICVYGDHNCSAAGTEDFFALATKSQIVKRLDEHRYRQCTPTMIRTLKETYNFEYGKDILNEEEEPKIQACCCINKRDLYFEALLKFRDQVEYYLDRSEKGYCYEDEALEEIADELNALKQWEDDNGFRR